MKPILSRFTLTVITALCNLSVYAYDFKIDGICYNINNDKTSVSVTYVSSSYGSYAGNITIPPSVTYNGTEYAVTSIGESAFNNCSSLQSVTIPNSVTSIGN
ncbi:MAG: leucine-rich repeat domain-containing protein, partial [Candidatus Amulumruptor caecigallinarius]|nr:leucine-rich repeat domain-containing protein [Candidatus Amulumruptor caecigallinarius]MCM1397047.1 leucine-rich repeat domain-containing protein [Candidatus Amulumruptor caecigallinarius]